MEKCPDLWVLDALRRESTKTGPSLSNAWHLPDLKDVILGMHVLLDVIETVTPALRRFRDQDHRHQKGVRRKKSSGWFSQTTTFVF